MRFRAHKDTPIKQVPHLALISLYLIVKNEEDVIARCLESVADLWFLNENRVDGLCDLPFIIAAHFQSSA